MTANLNQGEKIPQKLQTIKRLFVWWRILVKVAPVVDYPPGGSFGYRDNMDGDSNDEGTVTESLNGETKPDPAKLAQTAIIKQVSCKLGHNS